jgi:hypothetical protein
MNKTEIEILECVFGYRRGIIAVAPKPYRFCGFDKRINNAAHKLAKTTGLVIIKASYGGERMYEVVSAYNNG